ncbi:tail fiber assembly protein [Desulfovibrio sp.]|uniref:tail fiber assembly protein n=1 Tax=Desulfovibrio sp. TaxID=885 RepID=UPI003D0B863C
MIPLAYYWDGEDYYTHCEPCTTDPLESAKQGHEVYVVGANGCLDAPILEDGKWPKRVNDAWVNVENHVGEKGFVNGVPTTIEKYGPLPEGWSATPPVPTAEQLFSALRAARDARLSATDKYLLPDYPISESDLALVKTYRAALRDLLEQPGAPWDGGGEVTPWPELPSVE